MTKKQLIQAVRDEMAMRGIDGASDREIENALFGNTVLAEIATALMNTREEKYASGDGR